VDNVSRICHSLFFVDSRTAEGNKISQNQKNTRDTLFLHLYRKYYSSTVLVVQ
jgi:hypothetical protein